MLLTVSFLIMQYVKHGLLFAALCLPLSMVCVVTPELSSGETIGQWVWFKKNGITKSVI